MTSFPEELFWETWGKEPTYPKFYQPNQYLASREIREEVLKEFGVGFYSNPKSKSSLNNHILFPIHNIKGELLAFAWRTTSDEGQRYCFPPAELKLQSGKIVKFDRTLELWNLDRAIKEGSKVYVVEGFFSAMNLWQHDLRCVVALMGSHLSNMQIGRLIAEFETVTFLLDPDPAGQEKLKTQVIKKLLPRIPVRIVESPKDPDQLSCEELKGVLS